MVEIIMKTTQIAVYFFDFILYGFYFYEFVYSPMTWYDQGKLQGEPKKNDFFDTLEIKELQSGEATTIKMKPG